MRLKRWHVVFGLSLAALVALSWLSPDESCETAYGNRLLNLNEPTVEAQLEASRRVDEACRE